MEKKFKSFDKILVRDQEEVWQPDLYGFWDKCRDRHQTMMNNSIVDEDILPFEGNEHLVGTTDEPEEEIRLEEGEWCMFAPGTYDNARDWFLRQFVQIRETVFVVVGGGYWSFAIRFKDFDPNNMEETKKHILCVKDGRIVRYKG